MVAGGSKDPPFFMARGCGIFRAMARIEQCDKIHICVSGEDQLDLNVMNGEKRRLALSEHRDYAGVPEEGVGLLRTVMVAHLIAPYFPKIVETNFGISEKKFIDELYKYYGYRPPRFMVSEEVKIVNKDTEKERPEKIDCASAHSGGLDSAYRLAKMMGEDKKVLAVHLRNLNAKGNMAEYDASKEQCQTWGLPFEDVRLINNSKNNGFDTMRTRDFLLAVVAAVTAYPYGANKLLIEGDMVEDPTISHFSENVGAWKKFNQMLKEVNLKIAVEGVDAGDIETVGEVIKLEKSLGIEIISLVQNCFCAPFQRPGVRRKWNRETPEIAKNSSEHWCGSCIKCRRMTLGRLYYEDPKFANVSDEEVAYFVRDTYDWLKKYSHNKDLISKSFLGHLEELSRR